MTKPKRKKKGIPGPGPGRFTPGNPHRFKPKDLTAALPPITDDTGAFTAEALVCVTKLASLDKSAATIANSIGMTVKEFEAAMRANDALARAFEIGDGLARDFYVDRLRKHGKKFFISDIFAAKALHGLVDAPDSTDRGMVTVQVVTLPGAQPTGNLVEGEVVPDDHADIPGLTVVQPPASPRANGAPRDAAVPALPSATTAPAPPPRAPSGRSGTSAAERRAYRDACYELGLDTDRRSFTDAEWRRWNRDAPPKK